MWTYEQKTGRLISPEGEEVATGYAGHGDGVNNPDMQNVPDVGPIPCGLWSIGAPMDSPKTGPFSMPLLPHEGTETFGRDGFFMHGDAVGHAGERIASEGCIVMPPGVREQVWESGDHVLRVVPE